MSGTAWLAACSTAAPPPAEHSLTATAAPAAGPPVARLGTMVTVSATDPALPTTVPEAAPSAPDLAALPPAQQAFAHELASERQLPLAAVVLALRQAQRNDTVLRLMAPPAPPPGVQPRPRHWPGYRSRFVEPIRVRGGLAFWNEHATTLAEAEQRYGVPAAVIVAILGVETVYGRNMGNFRVLDSLYTLAFHWPAHARRDRSAYFRSELADYLAMTLSQGQTPGRLRGSFAGAIGMPQFMPGSIRRFAVTTTANPAPDLIGNPRDVIFSVANYLREHGWEPDVPVFIAATLPPQAGRLADGGLTPTLSWQQLDAAGIRPLETPAAGLISGGVPPASRADHLKLGLIGLEQANGAIQYRLASPNFFAITHYNRSYFYAAAVADLAAELQAARRDGRVSPPR